MENLISSWWKRFLVAGFLIIFMLILPEDMPFRVDVLRGALMGLAVSIVIYPAFSKAVQDEFLSKKMPYALAYCLMSPLLFSTIAAVDLFYLEEITLAVAFFVIALCLTFFWLLFEVALLHTRQPEWQQQLNPHKRYPTDGKTSESSPF